MPVAELELSPEIESAPVLASPAVRPCLPNTAADRALFADHFDRKPFQFRHSLHEHPAFQLPALLAAAERLASNPEDRGQVPLRVRRS